MKRYECDAGTIMIGNDKFRVNVSNGYGDGCFAVDVIDDYNLTPPRYFKWKCAVEGENFHIYDYDCLEEDELNEKHILFTLSGSYAVYAGEGNILLLRR